MNKQKSLLISYAYIVLNIIKVYFTFIKVRDIVPRMIVSESSSENKLAPKHPLLSLTEEELDLVLQLVLASGSLKDLASTYQVSYPTIRARVDRLIERVRQIVEGKSLDPMMQLLADLVERGDITVTAARAVRDLYRKQRTDGEEEHDTTMV